METVKFRLLPGDYHWLDGSAQVVVRLGADRAVVLLSHGLRSRRAAPVP
jgi:hypothetical protein